MGSDEIKVKSFRITEETAQKFKDIAGTLDCNQQETLSKLIEAFEFQSGKAVLTDKKGEIEQFERYTTALSRMFMGSLEENQNITDTVRTEFDALLKSKDTVIAQLQKDLQRAKDTEKNASLKMKELEESNGKLSLELEDLKNRTDSQMGSLENILKDKEKLNAALLDTCNDLKKKNHSLETEYESLKNIQEELVSLRLKYEESAKENVQLKNQLKESNFSREDKIKQLQQHELDALTRQEKEAAFTLEKKILEIQGSCQKEIQELKEQKIKEIEKYQKKYMDLLELIQKEKTEVSENQGTA